MTEAPKPTQEVSNIESSFDCQIGGDSFAPVELSPDTSDREDEQDPKNSPQQPQANAASPAKQGSAAATPTKGAEKATPKKENSPQKTVTKENTETKLESTKATTTTATEPQKEEKDLTPEEEEEMEKILRPKRGKKKGKSPSRASTKSESSIADKFNQFMREREQGITTIDESRVELAPPTLRPTLLTLIKNIKRWSARNPTGASLNALQILVERLDEYLELQTRRDDPNYEEQCRGLLGMIYKNTSQAQRLARDLKDAAAPRPIDEY